MLMLMRLVNASIRNLQGPCKGHVSGTQGARKGRIRGT